MKHIKTFLESKLTKELHIDEINSFCKFNGIRQYNITPDLKLDVDGYVDIEDMGLGVMPVKFGKIVGALRCGGNKLKDFNNFPDELIGNLYASKNNFKSLEGMPSIHGTTIDLSYNQLKSMKGIEKQIANNIILTGNKISEIDTNLSGFRDSTFLMDENPIYYIPSEYATKINILSEIPYMKLIGRLIILDQQN